MAVSGRKPSDFSGSLSKGSAEDFDHSCEPCLVVGKHADAHGFCVECQEYLCKNCFAYHKQMKATQTHQLLEKKNMDKQTIHKKDSELCTEKCTLHRNETIKFFCTKHEFLGCTDCITLDHRTCEIDYIPDKCAGIGDTEEYKETMKKLEQKIKELDEIMKRANVEDKRIDTCYEKALQDIIKFRKEINDHLDKLQRAIQAEVNKKKTTDKQKVKDVIQICSNMSSDIGRQKANLQHSKTSLQNGQLYIQIKHAQSKLKSDEPQRAEESLAQTNTHYKFERSKELEIMVSRQKTFGKLSETTVLVTPGKKKIIDKITHTDDINVRTKSDKSDCSVTGCAVLSSNKIVLADENNCKLKVVDRQSKLVIEEVSLDSQPRDIAVLHQNQIAVTMPGKREILIVATTDKMSINRRMPVKEECRGITYHQDHLYVVCWYPHCVRITGIQGNVKNIIPLDNKVFGSPNYIACDENARHIYISNYSTHDVVSITLQGEVSAVYKNKDFKYPLGMLMLEDGSLLACCYLPGTIHRISEDLKQGRTMIDGLTSPKSICYNHHQQEVCIACKDLLKVFSLQ